MKIKMNFNVKDTNFRSYPRPAPATYPSGAGKPEIILQNNYKRKLEFEIQFYIPIKDFFTLLTRAPGWGILAMLVMLFIFHALLVNQDNCRNET